MAPKLAGLRYVRDTDPGLRRVRAGRGFSYRDAEGATVRDRVILRRIRQLAIPPAWTAVWISPLDTGHIQAVGRDARGRKQYRYHSRWRELRDETKFERMVAFGCALPDVRAQVERDLARTGLPREKLLATVVRLLETTFIRVGNEEYARSNKSYGLTTLRNHHVEVVGSKLRFRFRGKSGKIHDVGLHDRRLARIVKLCQDIPGHELFQYVDDQGATHAVGSADVNAYLREASGEEFTAKDFRTWAGTILAARELLAGDPPDDDAGTKRRIVEAVKTVAARLGNTPAVCRAHYVHPALLTAYQERSLVASFAALAPKTNGRTAGLTEEEDALLRFLKSARPY